MPAMFAPRDDPLRQCHIGRTFSPSEPVGEQEVLNREADLKWGLRFARKAARLAGTSPMK